jgi:hypothetical protein
MVRGGTAVLYTSLEREGALAELSFFWGTMTPLPSKPMVVHAIKVETRKTIRLTRKDFIPLGINEDKFQDTSYARTQMIGDAAGFLGCDGLIAPCARWNCDNLVIFSDNHAMDLPMNVESSEVVDWQLWAKKYGFITSE